MSTGRKREQNCKALSEGPFPSEDIGVEVKGGPPFLPEGPRLLPLPGREEGSLSRGGSCVHAEGRVHFVMTPGDPRVALTFLSGSKHCGRKKLLIGISQTQKDRCCMISLA